MDLFKAQRTLTEIAKGGMHGAKPIRLRGRNAAISTSAETVWQQGAAYPALLSAAATFEAVSSSANDTSAGTGARTVVVEGLDSNFDYQSETITLSGASAVDTSNTYLAINRAYVATVGSGKVNAGNIDIQVDGGGNIHRSIEANQGLLSHDYDYAHTVARRHLLFIYDFLLSLKGGSDGAQVYLRTEDSNGLVNEIPVCYLEPGTDSPVYLPRPLPLVVQEKTLVELRVDADGGVGDFVAESNCVLYGLDSRLLP